MAQDMTVRAYTAGPGRRVHAGLVQRNPDLRNGAGVVCFCGVFERPGGSWEGHETDRPIDCRDCLAAADQHRIKLPQPKPQPVPIPSWLLERREWAGGDVVHEGLSILDTIAITDRARAW